MGGPPGPPGPPGPKLEPDLKKSPKNCWDEKKREKKAEEY